ncbi:hypothetical protein F3X89_28790 (plasmid) [Rhizobium rhizogenes]|nr:hypothetical protein F3X89_28790 [Rhizobium rhizogenes]TQO72489.1 hypothetical protein FFE80_33185 [Rhizobium rhizogenes]TRB23492.1 hypothetical protein EXN51_25775 [Agrobacterium fabrum]TRB53583.1 hypothetical protein EXN69_22015 [Rhizobium rhizogenes]
MSRLFSFFGPCQLPLASGRPQGRLRRGHVLHDPTIVSRALAAFALRGWWKSAREATGKEGKEERA